MDNASKSLVFFLLLTFLASLVALPSASVKASPKTITVPDDYPTIQAAISNASAGDTVFVKKGTYYVPPITSISKPLSLIGEDPQTTIIDSYGHNYQASAHNLVTFRVGANDVTISGFTITDCNAAIHVVNWGKEAVPSGCKIIGNIFSDNADSIFIEKCNNYEIKDNSFNGSGIGVSDGPGIISGNTIIHGNIRVYGKYVTISGNYILEGGISLEWTGPYYIYQNKILNSSYAGIEFGPGVANAQVHDNEIKNHAIGIRLEQFPVVGDGYIGTGNTVYRNNLIDNGQSVFVENTYSYWSPTQRHANGTDIVSWDNGKEGNYWSDYNGQGVYVIDENNVDYHPLTQQVDIYGIFIFIEIAIILIAAITTIFVIFYRRHRKASANRV